MTAKYMCAVQKKKHCSNNYNYNCFKLIITACSSQMFQHTGPQLHSLQASQKAWTGGQ